MDSTETTLVEFCAGYGGIGLGLGRVIENLRTIALCEIEGFAIENLVAKMEAGRIDQAPVWNDLKTFPSKQFHGLVDILSAGFPCQPFSCAGLRRADDDPRHLFPFIMDAVELIRPRFVFLENVEGLISAKLGSDCWADPIGTPVLLHVLRELERRGYTPTCGVFSASETGAPHQRKRVFILAYNVSEGLQGLRKRSKQEGRKSSFGHIGSCSNLWPSRPGEPQYGWEPPRVTGGMVDTKESGLPWSGRSYIDASRAEERTGERENLFSRTSNSSSPNCKKPYNSNEAQSTLGGNTNGSASRMDYAELCESCDNRVDELRLLGNGVVPATAAKAWTVLYERISKL